MTTCARNAPAERPQSVAHDGRHYPLMLERGVWRLRSRSKTHRVDFNTGASGLLEAKRRAKAWLEKNAGVAHSRKGGGSLETLAKLYLAAPKRTKENVARDNVSRLRSVCRLVFDRELAAVTVREVGPDLWQAYQVAALKRADHKFDLVTRRRENIAINSAVRAARCLFLPALLRAYRAAGLDPRPDAGECVMLPEPYVPPTKENDAEITRAWAELEHDDQRLWLAIGLARFAGLRREEISACRVGWIEKDDRGAVFVALRDRPEEKFWTKTGKPYRAQVIDPALSEWLAAVHDFAPPDTLIVPDPDDGDRARWFERVPQEWLHARGVSAAKPLHRMRGLYADHIMQITAEAIAARQEALKSAQKNLGHTSSTTTEAHYVTPDALR